MAKPSNREKILEEGLRVVHARGFAGASVRDIVQAAGVPQGSFTNHFASKEAFGLEILDRYFDAAGALFDATLRNEALPPLDRLRRYIQAHRQQLATCDARNGCLFGNFTAEACDHSEAIRRRLVEIFAQIENCVAACLQDAVQTGDLPPDFACADMAVLILATLQGATLLAKSQRSTVPLEACERTIFSLIRHRAHA